MGEVDCGRKKHRQNRIVERFFRSLEEECVWQHSFPSFVEARRAVRRRIAWYNERAAHQAPGHLSPRQYRKEPLLRVACGGTLMG